MFKKYRYVKFIIALFSGFVCCYLLKILNREQLQMEMRKDVSKLITCSDSPQEIHSTVSSKIILGYVQKPNDEATVFDPSADDKKCANASTSIMKLATQQTEFQLGDTIQVDIQLFDSYIQKKTTGGDFVHIWMKEEGKNSRAAGVITDHNNGSYTGTLKALWTGSPQIVAAVAGSRETKEIFYRIYRDHYTLRNITAIFESDGVKEETLCLPIQKIPGFKYVCNLTAENYGLPWYCGKPSHRKLLCHDLTGLHEPASQPLLFTDHERKYFLSENLHRKLPHAVQVKVKSDKEIVALPTTPCNKNPLKQSWEASTPVGFFYQNQWKSLTCNNTIPPDPQIHRKCLKDRTLWIHGDSTSRQWFLNFKERLGMSMNLVSEKWYTGKWHKPSVLRDQLWNSTIIFIPHEYPFYHGDTFSKMTYNRAAHAYLDELPSNSRDIFVLHLYLHFNPFPPEVYRNHVRRLVKSLRSLISRAPRVEIAIRGPHAFISHNRIGFLEDFWMYLYDSILRQEFRGFENKILFLNNIDLTIATENNDHHPSKLTIDSLINHFMGCVCKS